MKKITLYFSLLFIICSCSLEDDLVYTKPDNPVKSEFKLSEQEVVSNVTDFLENFYSEETSTRNSDYLHKKTKIKNISLLSKKDLPNTIETRNATEDLLIDSLLYFVNLDAGFIIAGADKRTMPIFAFIDDGNFSKEILKSNNIDDLPFIDYIGRIIYIINDDIKDNEMYANSPSTRAYPIKEKIFPLLGKTKWGQNSPYNLYCPGGSPTGCVMTALAQVSSYYHSPQSVIYGDNINENPLKKGFALNLDWNKIMTVSNNNGGGMPIASYNFINEVYNESQAVCLYLRYIGKMINANYGINSTTASFDNAIGFMRNIIGLKATDQHLYNRENLYKQIKGGNLVVLGGYNTESGFIFHRYSEGHTWIADGVFVSNHDHHYFHYNWGWSGLYNGFFFEDRWNPGRSEFDDAGNEIPQGDYGKDFKYHLKCSYISW